MGAQALAKHAGRKLGDVRIDRQLKAPLSPVPSQVDGPGEDGGRGSATPLPPHFFRRTSSSGFDHGQGLTSSSAGSATRGPMPLGQMYS